MTLSRLESIIRGLPESTRTKNMLSEVANGFATPEAFIEASKGALMKVYNTLHPGSDRSLGGKFFAAYDKVCREWRRVPEAKDSKELGRDQLLSRELTHGDLKRIVDFMEMFSVKSMTISKVLATLDTMGGGDAS